MIIGINMIMKFPFLNASRNYLRRRGLHPLQTFARFQVIREKIREFFNDAVSNYQTTNSLSEISENSCYTYGLIRIFLALLNNKGLIRKSAILLEKHYFSRLYQEDLDLLKVIATDMGIQLIVEGDDIKMNWQDYIRFSTKITRHDKNLGNNYKLVNKPLKDGKVELDKTTITKLISINVLIETLDMHDYVKKNPEWKDIFDKFRKLMIGRQFIKELELLIEEKITSRIVDLKTIPISPGSYPPCIISIIGRIVNSGKVNNNERMLLTYFMLTIGMESEKLIDLYSQHSDFDEKQTRYQVKYAYDKEYTPQNCDKLLSLKICKHKCNCTNPLVYYQNKASKKDESRKPNKKTK